MRIHEILETSIDYVACDGVLGSDPLALRAHLNSLDSKVQDDYFSYLWTILAGHPSFQIVLAKESLNGVGGAPPPSRPASRAATPATATPGPEDDVNYDELLTILGEDDNVAPAIKRTDLTGLLERYPTQLRIRCIPGEVYYRLTGSRTRITKISPIVLLFLQLAARSREQGITALELGPMCGINQNSAHHYIKVLVNLGLVAKVPTTVHGSSTNVVVFHRFLDKNPNYLANVARDRGAGAGEDEEIELADGEQDGTIRDLGFNFQPFSELELVAGHIPKDRLIRVLDHPDLTNHLLANHHLLQILGWGQSWEVRHRRIVQRHVCSLIDEGVVEYVNIGTTPRACLRLTKFNPLHQDRPERTEGVTAAEHEETDVELREEDYAEPFQSQGNASATMSPETQVIQSIIAAGTAGRTLVEIQGDLSGLFKRTTEHVINRHDLAYLPPHIRHRAIRGVMESLHRQRRLRIFTVEDYRTYMESLGFPLPAAPASAEQGRWADTSFRTFADTPEQHQRFLEKAANGMLPVGRITESKPRKRNVDAAPRKARAAKVKEEEDQEEYGEDDDYGEGSRPRARPKKPDEPKGSKYITEAQERGRPRKYVYVVNSDGTRNRVVVGNLNTTPELPPVLVYFKDIGVLVPAPAGYTGVGPVPPISEDVIEKEGKEPAYFAKFTGFPAIALKAVPKKRGRPPKRKGKGKAEAETDTDAAADAGADAYADADANTGLESPAGPPVKRPRRGAAPTSLAEPEDADMPENEPENEVASETPAPKRSSRRIAVAAASPAPRDTTPAPAGRLTRLRDRESRRPALLNAVAAVASLPRPAAKRGKFVPSVSRAQGALEDAARQKSATPALDQTSHEAGAQQAAEAGLVAGDTDPSIDPSLDLETQTGVKPSEEIVAGETVMDVDELTNRAAEPIAIESREPSAVPADLGARTPARHASATPAPAVGTPLPHGTPAPEVDEPLKPVIESPEVKPKGRRAAAAADRSNVRVDVAVLRRANEVWQCLFDSGGVLTDLKLFGEHRAWTERFVGTDHPNAPNTVSGMDRKVHRRMIERLVKDGRIKERIVTIPTSTGRWMKVSVLFTAGKDEGEVQTYIRALANLATTPSPMRTAVEAPDTQFSSFKRQYPPRAPGADSRQSTPGTPTPFQPPEPLSQREIYLNEPYIAGHLYGFITGRCLRAMQMHKALNEVFENVKESHSIISRSPRLFALPLLFEELRVRDYLKCVLVNKYDEELYQWTQVPGNLDLRLKDLSDNLADKAQLIGRGNQRPKGMIRTLLGILSFLQIITPVSVATGDDEVMVHCLDAPVDQPHQFTKVNDANALTYFVLHDVVPIYDIVDPSLSLLGFVNASKSEELDECWNSIRVACMEPHPPHIPRIAVPGFPFSPQVTGVLEMDTDLTKTLRARLRWRDDIRITHGQRLALNGAVDSRTGTRLVTGPEAVTKLAYDNALTVEYVEKYLNGRAAALRGEGHHRESEIQIIRMRDRIKREKEKEAIRDELAARIKAARQVYKDRVAAAAARAGVEVTQELLDYLTHNRPISRLGEMLSDQDLSAIIDSFVRVKSGLQAPRRATLSARPAPTIRATKRTKVTRPKLTDVKLRRHRHTWTKEEDELLIDGEAVIRARCRGTHNRGRAAISQVLPGIADQVYRTRLKKLLEEPGRHAYYQRLEDTFAFLLEKHRGDPELPDPNPQSHTEFDLRVHINFLRERVNKQLLKLPVSVTPSMSERNPDLLLTPQDIITRYRIEPLKPVNTSFDQIIDNHLLAEDAKLHNIALASIVAEDQNPYKSETLPPPTHRAGVIRSLLKMIVATPDEAYDISTAAQVLQEIPTVEVNPQIAQLIHDGVLVKNTYLKTTSRMFVFNAAWEAACEGPLPAEVEGHIDRSNEAMDRPEGVQWPVLGMSGDLMALMTAVSNNDVEIDFNIADLAIVSDKNRFMYNTRALNDDAFEFDFTVRRVRSSKSKTADWPYPNPREMPVLQAWKDVESMSSRRDIEAVIKAVNAAGAAGLPREDIGAESGLAPEKVDPALAALAAEKTQRVFWAGYDTARLVSTKHWGDWTVSLTKRQAGTNQPSSDPASPCLPRRWVDIWGDVITPEFKRARKAIVGHLMLRPMIPESALRERVAHILDRAEVTDALQWLVDAGLVERSSRRFRVPPVQATGVEEAKYISVNATSALWA